MVKGKTQLWATFGFAALFLVAVPGPVSAGSSAPELLAQGYASLRAGDEAAAERAYLEAVRGQPSYGPAWLVLGDFYYRVRHDCGAALPWYDGYLDRASGIAAPVDAVLEKMIGCHETAGNWDAAAVRCDRLVAWYRERRLHDLAAGTLRRRAENEIRGGRYEQALATLQTLLFRDANDRRVWELRAFARFQLGRYELALEDHFWIRSSFGPDNFVHREIGAVLFKLGRLEAALEALELSLRVDGEHAETFRWIARSHEELGHPGRAEAAWRQCLQTSPSVRLRARAQNNLAWLIASESRRGDPRLIEALSLAKAAVDIRGDAPAYQDTLTEVYLRLGRDLEALACAREAFRSDPSDPYLRARFVAVRDVAAGHRTSGGAVRFERAGSRRVEIRGRPK